MISMKELAQHCGVSVATVSKALNNQSDIGENTKLKVKKAAEEFGYYPNAAARSLKTNKSYNIGVLFIDEANSGLTHEYFAAVLEGFKVEAEKQGYDITFINGQIGKRKVPYSDHCKYRNVDGVVIACVNFDNPEVIDLLASKIPVVTVDHIHENCSSVLSDNIKGIQILMDYIYEKGHRKIAYIHGQGTTVTKARLTSFYRFLESHKLSIPEGYVLEADYLDVTQAMVCTKELLDRKDPPTCILYPDDTALIGGLNEIRARDLRVPDDISIAGYDGSRISQLLNPRLTTISQNTADIGMQAAKKLISTIEKPKTTFVEQIIVEGELLEGESVGNANIS
ncbi:LacI family DNA-binding transcriptional regulator [Clostridium sp. E02]|uniref:LacI family DNA-binding transcriptional regulator n=1 Tax=Clostridium sp. E02 TaxID=2487134 RepID=UPI000F534FA8|nr:LacI family DNA-binding transcriptional regulator [Clostridium sp. E02]